MIPTDQALPLCQEIGQTLEDTGRKTSLQAPNWREGLHHDPPCSRETRVGESTTRPPRQLVLTLMGAEGGMGDEVQLEDVALPLLQPFQEATQAW